MGTDLWRRLSQRVAARRLTPFSAHYIKYWVDGNLSALHSRFAGATIFSCCVTHRFRVFAAASISLLGPAPLSARDQCYADAADDRRASGFLWKLLMDFPFVLHDRKISEKERKNWFMQSQGGIVFFIFLDLIAFLWNILSRGKILHLGIYYSQRFDNYLHFFFMKLNTQLYRNNETFRCLVLEKSLKINFGNK